MPEEAFDAWVFYVIDRIDERTGLSVEVWERSPRDVQTDVVQASCGEDRMAIREALEDLWMSYCEEGER